MKNFNHIVFIRFDTVSSTVIKDWIEYRFKFFIDYTLKNLLNQTNKDFTLWIRFNVLFKEYSSKLGDYLKEKGIKYIFTYTRFASESWTDKEENYKELREFFLSKEYVYYTRIDSDDLYDLTVIDEIQNTEIKDYKALQYPKGYLYNLVNEKLYHYDRIVNPFYTLICPSNIFIDRQIRVEYYDGFEENKIYDKSYTKFLSDNKFVVLVHSFNATNENSVLSGSLYYIGAEIRGEEKNKILNNFLLK